MRPFQYERVDSAQAALKAAMAVDAPVNEPSVFTPVQYLAGGTNLVDMMKIDVMQPERLVDINALEKTRLGAIEAGPNGLVLGALARMAKVAVMPGVKQNYPMIADALNLAASQQLRNMASLGGNVLQRTRCTYFRDTSYTNCNKRNPGSGCAAMQGINRMHAVLGTSEQCIATYAGDFAQALIALDANVDIAGAKGTRSIPFATLHRLPGSTPHLETILAPGELITALTVPALPFAKRSRYLKVRDRESYEFALASAAIALDLDGDTVKDARIALGGVATVPWRAKTAEAHLKGRPLDDATLTEVAELAFAKAEPREHNEFKVELGKRTLIRALRETAAMEI
jgi:xanthine dehydrogenase YagS FAD-binding subunit